MQVESIKSGLQNICASYFIIINFIGLALMGVDKFKAKNKLWRIREKSFFVVSLLGGSVGSLLGMFIFRHKTKHWYFVLGIPLILILQVIIYEHIVNFIVSI